MGGVASMSNVARRKVGAFALVSVKLAACNRKLATSRRLGIISNRVRMEMSVALFADDGKIKVTFQTHTPNFKCFEIQMDGGGVENGGGNVPLECATPA